MIAKKKLPIEKDLQVAGRGMLVVANKHRFGCWYREKGHIKMCSSRIEAFRGTEMCEAPSMEKRLANGR